ncbi:cell division protein FtsB [Pseudomaricurvus alkylphenolicus]|jgi:cell division protein FtsB|uniref:cell division protein FtsB n=1 Tax=Pseudomaricurvus alkylphenolicus TaxID=1306991 RepID=UPI00142070C6|nr:cell division protein FtsB [Pseudomaricurvus alkylphenolicus]NIB39799.1 cell division protein FtsB [Pseudomaricurvus alkylphenolicus]
MKWLIPILVILLAGLQYRLWVGEGSLAEVVRLSGEIETQRTENERLRERNRVLAAEVEGLKSGLDAVEERAREDLGMIKPGETLFMVVEPEER